MAATLGFYNPQFYAAEALQILMKSLGFAKTVYHGYEGERNSFGKGDIINIRKPGLFKVQDAPATAEDVVTESVSITLNKWKEVKFKLTDKDLSLTQDRIITEHIAPAAYQIADFIDSDASSMVTSLALNYSATAATRLAAITSSTAIVNMTTVRQRMLEGMVPMRDPSQLFCMIDPATEAAFLQNTSFNQDSGAGSTGVATQISGNLGPKFGVNWFSNNNTISTPAATAGTQLAADTLTTVGTQLRGASALECTTSRSGATLIAGARIKLGNYVYRVRTTTTASTTNFTGANNIPIDEVVHEEVATAIAATLLWNGENAIIKEVPFYHRNAMAFVSAPLSELGKELGAQIFAVQDPVTGISLRARLYYMGDLSTVHVALDVLYGYKVLNNNLGGTIKGTP